LARSKGKVENSFRALISNTLGASEFKPVFTCALHIPRLNTMADGDETAKLWKVNRTIHELVKDRVRNALDLMLQLALHRVC